MGAVRVLLPLVAVLVCFMSDAGNAHSIGRACGSGQQGDVRYNLLLPGVEYCDGHRWRPSGDTLSHSTATSCFDILLKGDSHGDGFYSLVTANGTRYQAFCDMTLEGGGWTLFATKASQATKFLGNTFNVDAASATDHDAAGCIPTGNFTEVMFRFRHDQGAARVIYSKNLGAPSAGRTNFHKALQCNVTSADQITNMDGFYRHSPSVDQGARDPTINFHTIPRFYVHAASTTGLSEGAELSDQWLNIWKRVDSQGNRYSYSDSGDARGRKCIAGHCYVDEPIYVMYR